MISLTFMAPFVADDARLPARLVVVDPGKRILLFGNGLLPSDRHHGTGSRSDHALRHASEKEPRQSMWPVRADNNEVRFGRAAGADDLLSRIAITQHHGCPDAGLLGSRSEPLGR